MTSPRRAAPLRGLACLVLLHRDPDQALLLLDVLTKAGAHGVLHVDRRADAMRDALAPRLPPGATLLPRARSRAILWGGFAMVRATLELMREALRDPATRHLCLLSGAHLPIRPPDEIADFLFDGRMHLDLRLAAGEPVDRESLARFWYRGLPGREADRPLLRLLNRNAWRLGRRDVAGGLRGMTPMVGSQWWHMSAPCARHLLGFLDANPWYERFFRQVRIPDESFFQTLVGASPFAGAVGEAMSWQHIEAFSPAPVSHEDLALARASGRPFARKFDRARVPETVEAALAYAGARALDPALRP